MQALLQRLVPECRIGIAHGQMPERTLEAVMMQFLERHFDLLLCTTIIESGLDIPSANTIIINHAETRAGPALSAAWTRWTECAAGVCLPPDSWGSPAVRDGPEAY